MNRVFIANFGVGNSLWPIAKANNAIITIDNVAVHPFWQKGDRAGYIETALSMTTTTRGEPPTRSTASRWYNLVEDLQRTEGDVWISRQGEALWWTESLPGALREEIQPSNNPSRDGPQVWMVEKPCRPWSDRDGKGRRLLWNSLHPKAQDFLRTEATFQSIANDRGYADYARALTAGDSLQPWHDSALFKDKLAAVKRGGAKIYSAKETSAFTMARQIFATVSQANGQIVERRVKEKDTDLSEEDWRQVLLEMLGEQEDRCKLTGLPFQYPGDGNDKELLPSLDRIDSNGHYTLENVQIVCRFMNRWKNADPDPLVRRLIELIRSGA